MKPHLVLRAALGPQSSLAEVTLTPLLRLDLLLGLLQNTLDGIVRACLRCADSWGDAAWGGEKALVAGPIGWGWSLDLVEVGSAPLLPKGFQSQGRKDKGQIVHGGGRTYKWFWLEIIR
jgi:hypothetical protein